jgi:hypothetical protein
VPSGRYSFQQIFETAPRAIFLQPLAAGRLIDDPRAVRVEPPRAVLTSTAMGGLVAHKHRHAFQKLPF